MKSWMRFVIGLLVVAAIGVGYYVGIKKVAGLFVPDVSALQRQVDDLVGELDGARSDLSGLRDSFTTFEGRLSDLGGELERSAETAARIAKGQRELAELLSGAEAATGVLGEGIDRSEAALLRFREYLDRYPEDGGD